MIQIAMTDDDCNVRADRLTVLLQVAASHDGDGFYFRWAAPGPSLPAAEFCCPPSTKWQ